MVDCHRCWSRVYDRRLRCKYIIQALDGWLHANKAPEIFAINTVVPMIGIVYYGGMVPPSYQFALNVATLLGSMFGQVLFGILADKYGRRKMYGLELVVTIIASLGFALSAPGVNNSMSIIGLFIFWRLVMGCGIGADYPLSATITSEYVQLTPLILHPFPDCSYHLYVLGLHPLDTEVG
jgi:MFS family permease